MTLRTRSLLGHRLFERLASRLGGTRRGSGSTLFERLGLEDPWANRYGASPGFEFVYLTLPDEEEDDEAEPDETARQLMERIGRRARKKRRQAARKGSARRRMIERIAAGDRDRPGVRQRLSRVRGLNRTSRPTHGAMYESDFVYTEPELAPIVEEEPEERIIRWGTRSSRPARTRRERRASKPAPRLDLTPPRSAEAAARVERPARGRTQATRPADRPLSQLLRSAGQAAAVQPATSGDPRAHEAVSLLNEARQLRDSAARVLRDAAVRIQRAPAGQRERMVRQAVRSLPPVARRAAAATVRSAPRTGATPIASVSARLEGIGRGQRSLRPALWSSPSLVPLTFEEPEPASVPEPEPSPVPRHARTAHAPTARRASQDARRQVTPARGGPPARSLTSQTAVPAAAPPTERMARRAIQTLATTGTPTTARGMRAVATPVDIQQVSRRAVARLASPTGDSIVPRPVARQAVSSAQIERGAQRSARIIIDGGSQSVAHVASRAERADVLRAGPVTSGAATAQRSASRAEVRGQRTTSGTVRALRRARPVPSRRGAVFHAPTAYVMVEPDPAPTTSVQEDPVDEGFGAPAPAWRPSRRPARVERRSPAMPTTSTSPARTPAVATRSARTSAQRRQHPISATAQAVQRLAVPPTTRIVATRALRTAPPVQSLRTQRPAGLTAAHSSMGRSSRRGVVSSLRVAPSSAAAVLSDQAADERQRPIDRARVRSTYERGTLTSPSVRAVERSRVVARDAGGTLKVMAPRAGHVVRRTALWSPEATILEPHAAEHGPADVDAPQDAGASAQQRGQRTAPARSRGSATTASTPAARPSVTRASRVPDGVAGVQTHTLRAPAHTPPVARAALRGATSPHAGGSRPTAHVVDAAPQPSTRAGRLERNRSVAARALPGRRPVSAPSLRRASQTTSSEARLGARPGRTDHRQTAARSSSRGLARAARRGQSTRRLSAGGSLWPAQSPMVHVEPEPELAQESIIAGAVAERPVHDRAIRAARTTKSSPATVAERVAARVATPAADTSVVARVERRGSPDGSVSGDASDRVRLAREDIGRGRAAPARRFAPWTPEQTLLEPTVAEVDTGPDELVERPTVRAARRSVISPQVDRKGRDTGRDRVSLAPVSDGAESARQVRQAVLRRISPDTAPTAGRRASVDTSTPSTRAGRQLARATTAPSTRRTRAKDSRTAAARSRRGRSTPTLRAASRSMSVSPRRRAFLAAIPVSYLEPEELELDVEATADSVTPQRRRTPNTARMITRGQAPVSLDSRGVARTVSRPAAYVDMGSALASRSMGRGPDRSTSRRSSLASMVSPRLDIVLEGFDGADQDEVREAVAEALRTERGVERRVSSDGRVERVVRISRRRTTASRAAQAAEKSSPSTVERVAQRAQGVAQRSDVSRGAVPELRRMSRRSLRDGVGRRARVSMPESTLLTSFEILVEGGEDDGVRSTMMVPVGASARALSRQLGAVSGVTRQTSRPQRLDVAAARAQMGRSGVGRTNPLISAYLDGMDLVSEVEPREVLQQRLAARTGEGARPRRFSPVAGAELIDAGGADELVSDGASPAARMASRLTPRRGPSGSQARPYSGQRRAGRPYASASMDRARSEPAAARRGRAARRRRPLPAEATFAVPRGEYAQDLEHENEDVPVWARRDRHSSRAGGRDRILGERSSFRADHPVVNALARAASPDEIVRLVSDGSVSREELRQALPSPAVKLVERIVTLERTAQKERREQARHVMGLRMRGTGPAPDFVRPNQASRSAGSVSGPRQFLPVAGADRAAAVQASRVTQLANKLLNLIHLAEVDQRVKDAQAHVRMSDSDPGSTASGSGESAGSGGQNTSQNIKALSRQVTDRVLSEIELLKHRSMEDPDGHAKWW